MRRSLFLLGVLVLISGCSSNSFVGRRFDNFTAYYNKFYNAQKAIKRGLDALEQQTQPVDRNVYIPVFSSPGRAANLTDFQASVDKGADVLRGHPDSKWMDDALLLIGKAYFYQQNFAGAEGKFKEVIEVSPKLGDEARFWLARTLIASGNYDLAHEHLIETLNREDLHPRWEPQLRLALGELYVKREQWTDAVEQLQQGLERNPGGDIGGRAQFLLGQVYETLGQYEDAFQAFQRVQRYNPVYELSYAAQYSAVRVAGWHVDADQALRLLRRMERDDKNFTNRSELLYLRGQIYQALERADDAFIIYDDLLYDSETNVSNLRGRVHYALGELYRDFYDDYLLAAAHFDTARSSLGQRPTSAISGTGGSFSESQFTPEAITDAQEVSDVFKNFSTVRLNIHKMDSLLEIGTLDDGAFEEFVHNLRIQRAEELEEQRREQARRAAEQGFQNTVNAPSAGRGTGFNSTQADAAAGFLFYKNRMRVEEGWTAFVQVWGERPHLPNWRRQEEITTLAQNRTNADSGAVVIGVGNAQAGEDALPSVDVSEIPRDSVSRALMLSNRAMARYELANVLFLSMNAPDSAATWYRMVIDEDSEEPVAQRAYYALAEVHRSLGDSLTAHRLYEQILRMYPNSDYIGQVRERLGLPPQEVVISDSLTLAEDAYREAYIFWRKGDFLRALEDMLTVAATYPKTDVAPRALLACGSIYLEWANADSLDLFGPLPINLPDSLLKKVNLFSEKLEVDSLGTPALLASADSSVLVDTVEVAPENMAVFEDSLSASSDTLLSIVDSLGTPTDVQASEVNIPKAESNHLDIETLFSNLASHYASTPYAENALQILTVLKEERAKLNPPDSVENTGTDILVEQALDSSAASVIPDSTLSNSQIPDVEKQEFDSAADSSSNAVQLREEDLLPTKNSSPDEESERILHKGGIELPEASDKDSSAGELTKPRTLRVRKDLQ